MESILKYYIRKAVEAEKAGLEVDVEEKTEPVPQELQQKLDENPDLNTAFGILISGWQKGYILYLSDSKQSKTRERRIEKYTHFWMERNYGNENI